MSRLVEPVVPAGRMRDAPHPTLHAPPDLRLRPWRSGDAASVLAAFSDPDIRYWHMRAVANDAEARAWIASWRPRWAAETDAGWAIAAEDSDSVLGQVALRSVNLGFGHADITYWVLPMFRGGGVAARATSEVARWAFGELGLHRLVIEHSVANAGSCRVAQKAGFATEGTMRSALLQEDGWHDMHVHGRVGEDT